MLFVISFLVLLLARLPHQYTASVTPNQINGNINLSRGINLSHWFFQPTYGYTKKHLETWITENDFRLLAQTQVTHIRLPVDPVFLQQKEYPYQINYQNFNYLDRALHWAKKYNLSAIIDLHPDEHLDLQAGINSQAYKNLENLWLTIVKRYQHQSSTVLFELLNEPNVDNPRVWHEISQKLVDAIRQIDRKHTLVVAAPGMSGPSEIADLIPVSDRNIIYTFHFYNPLAFTHQKAFWVTALSQLENVPYPYDAKRLKNIKQNATNALAIQELQQYEKVRYNQHKLAEDLQSALQFRRRYHVPIYCGEFGVYEFAPQLDKYRWLQDITQLLRQENIGYAMWEYHGSFGVIGEKTKTFDWRLMESAGLSSES
ncbi:glycoside hydrolase family 5 protein [Calothrix sp. NIES-2098]|uniref:glycoside hydrolase family 5 protein n=1 Tax=Calothrix sp. NIES-2098 TaxID=1954171 RepID=UPI0030DB18DE